MPRRELFFLVTLVVIGVIFRFYDIFWGAPFYFHPDERNVAGSISQLHFPNQLNPHFFAYGALPIYITFLLGLIQKFLSNSSDLTSISFENSIHTLRILSAFFSTILIPLLYFCGKELKDSRTGVIAAIFSTFSIGFIQYAHFGTFEMWLTILSLSSFYVTLLYIRKPDLKHILLLSFLFGLLISTKISSLMLLPLFLLPLIISKKVKEISLKNISIHLLLILLVPALIFILTNPFSFLDFSSFSNSITYESNVATGKTLVFYTGEFLKSNPFTFHLLHVYPFLLNPLALALLIPSLVGVTFLTIKNKQITYFLLLIWLAGTFIPQTLLFVKWTRYVIPTLPFIYLLITLTLSELFILLLHNKSYVRRSVLSFLTLLILCINYFFAYAYLHTAYVQDDTRIVAAQLMQELLTPQTKVISEVYDLGITPFNGSAQIMLFNVYDLDPRNELSNLNVLSEQLSTSEYLILPSQRVLKTRIQDAENFPQGHTFYNNLLQGRTQFSKLYETPCDFFCRVTYWTDPIFSFEQTVNIFDRPSVFIFKNNDLTNL